MSEVRKRAYEALERIDAGAYPNLALNEKLSGLSHEQRSFASSLVYTTLENQGEIDEIIARHVKKAMRPAPGRVLRMGVCQIVFMAVPESAAVNESVKLIKTLGKSGLSGFINGTLRSIAREEPKREPKRPAPPKWICEMWARDYGEEIARRLIVFERANALVIRRNPLRIDETDFINALDSSGFEYERGELEPNAIKLKSANDFFENELFTNGLAAVQGEASQWACRVLDARPGQSVLDMCAAPGGKTALIAAYMQNEGSILAFDQHAHRIKLVNALLKRLGVTCASTEVRDATAFLPEHDNKYDAVLVDAPCSGLGVNKPGLYMNKKPEDIAALAALQLELLLTAANCIKPGGSLVYSTCTMTKSENDAVADAFEAARPDFTPDPLERFMPGGEGCGARIQLFPHMYGTDGFFVARWLA